MRGCPVLLVFFRLSPLHGPVSLWSPLTVNCVADPGTCESWGAWAKTEPQRWGLWSLCQAPWSVTDKEACQLSCLHGAAFEWGGRVPSSPGAGWAGFWLQVLRNCCFYSLHSVPKIQDWVPCQPRLLADWFFPSLHFHWALGLHGFWLYGEVRSSSPPHLAQSLVLTAPAHLRKSWVWVLVGHWAACGFRAGFCLVWQDSLGFRLS